jgi:hypothetical protein
MAARIAFVDWWFCDEEGARAHAKRVIAEQRGDFHKACAELGMRGQTVMHGRLRLSPCAKFLLVEARRVRAFYSVHRRIPETLASGDMMAWR